MPGASRLSLVTCRRLLGASSRSLSDTEVVRLVDEMYELARIVVTLHERDSAQSDPAALRLLPSEDREAIEERAAVLEFDAGMTRSAATRTAFVSHRPTMKPPRPDSNR
jgi:hypothetical protein